MPKEAARLFRVGEVGLETEMAELMAETKEYRALIKRARLAATVAMESLKEAFDEGVLDEEQATELRDRVAELAKMAKLSREDLTLMTEARQQIALGFARRDHDQSDLNHQEILDELKRTQDAISGSRGGITLAEVQLPRRAGEEPSTH